MKHLALYRKWRPQRFSEVVGQEHISRTLLNAIRLDRLAHAYLFCGPRGTGKTTSARLLAKALNCLDPQEYEPCNACQNCEEITAGHSLDVIEIDAASNRGIDSARELREQVRFAASGGKYRVFIIDEFHMLTKEAFNALLKTLEEPPERVIFVLATTEPHEVLATIVSRCQRFDFQRIASSKMALHLQHVATAEQIGISTAAIEAISRKANGGLRDALSLLDQVQALAAPGESLPDPLVYRILGLVQEQEVLSLLQSAFAHDPVKLLASLQELLEQGHDPMQIVQELIQLLRHLSLAQLPAESLEQMGVPSHLVEAVQQTGRSISQGQLVSALDLLLRTGDRLHKCSQPDIWLQADLLCLCLEADKSLLHRIEKLESGQVSAPRQRPAAASAASAPAARPETPTQPISRPERAPAETPPRPVERPPEAATAPRQTPAAPLQATDTVPAINPLAGPPPTGIENQWQAFLEQVKLHQKPVIGFLLSGELLKVRADDKTWVLNFSGRFQRDRIEHKLKDGSLQDLVSQIMGEPYQIEVMLSEKKKSSELDPSATKTSSAAAEAVQPPPLAAPDPDTNPVPVSIPEPPVPVTPSKPLPDPVKAPPAPVAIIPEARAEIKQEITPDTESDEDDFGDDLVDMSYLPSEAPVLAQVADTAPAYQVAVSQELASLPLEPAQSQEIDSVTFPARVQSETLAEAPHLTPAATVGIQLDSLGPAEHAGHMAHLQEIADMFKGKIVEMHT